MRGSRRSFATRPRRSAPDASRSRQAPARTSGGTCIQPVVADSGESPTPRLDRLPCGSPSPMEDLHLSTDPPAAPRLTPRIAPGRSPNAPFGQRSARRLFRCLFDPPHCAGKRADRPEGKSSRKTLDPPFRPFTARANSHGRRPALDDWRPLREAIAHGLPAAAPATSAFAESPRMHRSPAKGTEVLGNPALTRTIITLKELDHARNKKVKYSRKFL